MSNSIAHLKLPANETVLSYAPGTPEREALQAQIEALSKEPTEIPLVIGGEEIKTGNVFELTSPHDHKLVIARVHQGGDEEARAAIDAALKARKAWAAAPCCWRRTTSGPTTSRASSQGPRRAAEPSGCCAATTTARPGARRARSPGPPSATTGPGMRPAPAPASNCASASTAAGW